MARVGGRIFVRSGTNSAPYELRSRVGNACRLRAARGCAKASRTDGQAGGNRPRKRQRQVGRPRAPKVPSRLDIGLTSQFRIQSIDRSSAQRKHAKFRPPASRAAAQNSACALATSGSRRRVFRLFTDRRCETRMWCRGVHATAKCCFQHALAPIAKTMRFPLTFDVI